MATIQTNDAQAMGFELCNGTVTITYGGDDYIVNQLEGSFTWENGNFTPVINFDGPTPSTTVLAGQQGLTTLRFSARVDQELGSASELYTLMNTAPTSGAINKATIVAVFRDSKDATTGKSFTFANCLLGTTGIVSIEPGDASSNDRLVFNVTSLAAAPTPADWTSA